MPTHQSSTKDADLAPSASVQLSVKKLQPPNSNPPLSLLDSLSVWLDTPELAYSYWLHSQDFEASSRIVYNAMFKRFCKWLEGDETRSPVRLEHCTDQTIKEFLAAENTALPASRKNRTNTGRQKQQYVRILERVFLHLGELGLSIPNPGRKAGQNRVGAGSDKPSRFLSEQERTDVIALIETKLAEIKEDKSEQDRWMEVRDMALVGATIGGGMKPQHLKSLTLNCIKISEGVIDCSTPAHSHRASLLPFAAEALALWVRVIEALTAKPKSMKEGAGVEDARWRNTQTVFIADRNRHGFGHLSASPRMHPSSIFRRIQGFLAEAGISGDRASAQTLRNTYAAMLIDAGATNAELVTCLGLNTELTAQRLRMTFSGKHKAVSLSADPAQSS